MLVNPFLRFMEKFYSFFIAIGSNLQSLLLLYLRIAWGHRLIVIGLMKFKHMSSVIEIFTKLGIEDPTFESYAIGFFEFVGGIALLLGFASRIFAIPVAIVMLLSLSIVHGIGVSHFHFLTNPKLLFVQEPYPYLFTALVIFIFGPGRISIDAWLKRWIGHQPRF